MNNMLKANPLAPLFLKSQPKNGKCANYTGNSDILNPVTPPADSKSNFEKSEFVYF